MCNIKIESNTTYRPFLALHVSKAGWSSRYAMCCYKTRPLKTTVNNGFILILCGISVPLVPMTES